MNNYKTIVISYREALDMLYKHLEIPLFTNEQGVNDILEILVRSYLCDNIAYTTDIERRLINTLEYYGLNSFESNDFETSEIGYNVSRSIIMITDLFLPGFKSYDRNCSIDKECIQFISSSSVAIHLNMYQFNLFAVRQPGFLNERSNY